VFLADVVPVDARLRAACFDAVARFDAAARLVAGARLVAARVEEARLAAGARFVAGACFFAATRLPAGACVLAAAFVRDVACFLAVRLDVLDVAVLVVVAMITPRNGLRAGPASAFARLQRGNAARKAGSPIALS